MSVSAQRVYGEPGTLYARCGGVFGVAAFADRCMDRWMADQQLNDNALVSRWHKSAQRPGFKFLVVQIICNALLVQLYDHLYHDTRSSPGQLHCSYELSVRSTEVYSCTLDANASAAHRDSQRSL